MAHKDRMFDEIASTVDEIKASERPGFQLAWLLLLFKTHTDQPRCSLVGLPPALMRLSSKLPFYSLLVAFSKVLKAKQLKRIEDYWDELDEMRIDPTQLSSVRTDLRTVANAVSNMDPIDKEGRGYISDVQELIANLQTEAIEKQQ